MPETFDADAASAAFDKARSDFAAIPLHPVVLEWADKVLDDAERLVAAGILSPVAKELGDAGEAIAVGAAGALAGGAVASAGATPLAPLAAAGASEGLELAINALRAAAEKRAKEKLSS